MKQRIHFEDIVVDCRDAEKLCNFYAALLGWEKIVMYDLPALKPECGPIFLFNQDDDYVPPVWPEESGKQQKQLHFDFQVPDVDAMVKQAEALGAKKAETQFGGDAWTTMFDPAGHPFCLCHLDEEE